MDKSYQSIMQYYAIDMKKVSVEDFLTDLNNFRTMFMVCQNFYKVLVSILLHLLLLLFQCFILLSSVGKPTFSDVESWLENFQIFKSIEKCVFCSLFGLPNIKL